MPATSSLLCFFKVEVSVFDDGGCAMWIVLCVRCFEHKSSTVFGAHAVRFGVQKRGAVLVYIFEVCFLVP